MNNDALVAALGLDAVAAVRGYRLQVISGAARRGLRLVSEAPSELVPACADAHVVIDPIDIRLIVLHSLGCGDLGGGMLSWSPARGWAVSRSTAHPPFCYHAGPGARPIDLVPTASQVVDWVTGGHDGSASPPAGVELDDDPAAIQRLLGYVNPKYRTFLQEAFADCTPRQVRERLLRTGRDTERRRTWR
jgi:hypothetical protein